MAQSRYLDDPEVEKQVVVNAMQTNWNDELLLRNLKTTTDKKTEKNHAICDKICSIIEEQG